MLNGFDGSTSTDYTGKYQAGQPELAMLKNFGFLCVLEQQTIHP